MGQGQTWPHFH